MIRSIKVELNAAFPQMPLVPFQVFHDSAAAVTILNVPRRIVSLSLKVKNVSGAEQTFAAQRSGSSWGVVIPASFFSQSGTSTKGVKVIGVDADANAFTLGAADLVVLLDDGTVSPVHPSGDGDMKHSEFLDLEAPDNMTQKESNQLLKTIVSKLKGPAVLLLSACCLSALAAITPDTDFGDISPTAKLSKVIHSTVDGSAKMLPKYLWQKDFYDSYPEAAEEYYRSRGDGKVDGGCSAVRRGGYLYRNFDYPLDDRAEFVVKMSAGAGRFASVGVAQVGTNLTEAIVTSGKPSIWYKALPGATVDGINENGVVAEINVVDGDPQTSGWHTTGDLHPLGAIRWILDHATNAQHAATYIAANIRFPQGWSQNFHYMIADATSTYIVENGSAHAVTNGVPTMTNFKLYPARDTSGAGQERYTLLFGGANITNAWYTRAYHRETNPPWVSDLRDVIAHTNEIFDAWATHPKEYFRGKTSGGQPWWQTIHTSVYDISNKTMRIAVQETDDWYTFAVPSAGGTDEAKVREIAADVVAPVASQVSDLESSKLDTASPDGAPAYMKWGGKEVWFGWNGSGTDDNKLWIDTQYGWLTFFGSPSMLWFYGGSQSLGDILDGKASIPDVQAANAKAEAAQAHSEATREIVYTWEQFLDGSNVVFAITNYISGTYSLDHSKFEIRELRDGEYRTVYESMTEITNHTEAAKREMFGVINSTAQVLRAEIASKGDKAWGRRSSTGNEVPISNTVWVTEQTLRIAGGMEYERVAVGEGAIYVLASKGQSPYLQGDEGSIMIHDDGGTNYFGMVRSDSYTIGANTDGIRKEGNLVYLDYNVTMSDHPCVWYTPTLEGTIVWEQLNTPDGSPVPGASHEVVWDDSPRLGAQECYINVGNAPRGFFRATIEVPGAAKFSTNMPAEFGGGIYCTDGEHKVKVEWNNGSPRFVEVN